MRLNTAGTRPLFVPGTGDFQSGPKRLQLVPLRDSGIESQDIITPMARLADTNTSPQTSQFLMPPHWWTRLHRGGGAGVAAVIRAAVSTQGAA
jgi:hypothetical protein